MSDRIEAAARRAGRAPGAVRLVAVTKQRSLEQIRALLRLDQWVLGENRVQEARRKFASRTTGDFPGLELHLIGHLQTNKAAMAAALFDIVESVDSERVARALARARSRGLERGEATGPLPVLLQVNTTAEPSKAGIPPAALSALLDVARELPELEVQGLMTMASLASAGDPEAARPAFVALRRLAEQHREGFADPARVELSMGMSGDFEAAVEEGATLVRVGTALFAMENGGQDPEPGPPEGDGRARPRHR